MAECCGMVPSPVIKVYRLKEARKKNIQPLRPLLTRPGNLDSKLDDEDDNDSGISSHGNGNGSVSSTDLSKSELITCLSSASLKSPAYIKGKILWDFKTSRPGTELSVDKGEIVYLLYRERDQVLVINSEGKRGFVPLRYCSLLHKKTCSSYGPSTRPSKQLYNDSSFDNFLTKMDHTNKNTITSTLYMNSQKSNSRFGSNDFKRERPNASSSSEEDSDYSFRGTSGHSDMTSWSRNCSESFRERQKITTSFFRKGEEAKMSVLYDFIARDENDISVYKGETITVLNRDDGDWWWIATPEGYEGFVPRTYLSRLSSVSSQASTTSSSIESSSLTSEASSTQAVRFQDPLCTFHRYEAEDWETDSEISTDKGYPVDNMDERETGLEDSDKSRWSTWC